MPPRRSSSDDTHVHGEPPARRRDRSKRGKAAKTRSRSQGAATVRAPSERSRSGKSQGSGPKGGGNSTRAGLPARGGGTYMPAGGTVEVIDHRGKGNPWIGFGGKGGGEIPPPPPPPQQQPQQDGWTGSPTGLQPPQVAWTGGPAALHSMQSLYYHVAPQGTPHAYPPQDPQGIAWTEIKKLLAQLPEDCVKFPPNDGSGQGK